MLKNLSNLGTVLTKTEQKNVQGGNSFLCAALCGPGDGNTPIYEENPFDNYPLPEEVGCVCGS